MKSEEGNREGRAGEHMNLKISIGSQDFAFLREHNCFLVDKTDFIKRIIGLPGDKVKMENGRLFINGEEVKREEVENFVLRDDYGNGERFHQYIETLPGGKQHNILELSDYEKEDNTPEVVVPQNSYFVMGDNRDRSDDSRVRVGFVPAENLVGKARFLFFSHNNDDAWYQPWYWPRKIRWSRLFNKIN